MSSLVDEVKGLLLKKERVPIADETEVERKEIERQLGKLLEQANSVSEQSQVNGATLLTQRYDKYSGNVYYFDKEGELVHISQRFIEFDNKMKVAQKRVDKINRQRRIKRLT